MAVELLTGQPGHGKTQLAIRKGLDFVKAGRTVYAGNIRGLKYADAGFVELERFEDWESCPDGSVVIWDECYDALPQRGPGKKVPAHVEALARHRHRGFDFILIAQQTKQLDTFVSGLIERHIHCRRKFGTSMVRLREFDRWEREPEKSTPLVTGTWRLDPKVWPLYESATQHTVKRRIPWYVYALPLAIIGVIAAWIAVPTMFVSRAAELERSGGGETGALATGAPRPGSAKGRGADPLRYTDPVAFFHPRIDGQPWTAPAYDDVEIAPPPRIACMSSKRSCTCLTVEQGTTYATSELACRTIARLGYFDPTYQPRNRDERAAPEPRTYADARSVQPERPTAAAAGWSAIPIRSAYRQPQAIPDYAGGLSR